MILFIYDHTFEGLLTCIFDAYFRKTFPDSLLMEGDIPNNTILLYLPPLSQ